MSAFHDVVFPTDISEGSRGGPSWNTTVIGLRSGAEARNRNMLDARYKYNVAYGVRSNAQMAALVNFFNARAGRYAGFKYFDWADFCSRADNDVDMVGPTDQALALVAGETAVYQLSKTYSDSGATWTRTITRPITGTVRIARDGVEVLPADVTYPWSVSLTTGRVTFSAGAPGGAITAGFQFYVPVRFDVDEMPASIDGYEYFNASDINLVEIREC